MDLTQIHCRSGSEDYKLYTQIVRLLRTHVCSSVAAEEASQTFYVLIELTKFL